MFIYSLLCFFCLCCSLFFRIFLNLYCSFFVFVLLKMTPSLNCSSLFGKTFWFYRFFLFRPFFDLFFFFFDGVLSNKIKFTFFWSKNHLSNKSLQEFLFWFSVIGYFLKSSIIIFRFFYIPFQKKNSIFWSFWKNIFFKKKWRNMFYHKSCFLQHKHFCPDLILWWSLRVQKNIRLSSFFRKSLSLSYLSFFSFAINFRKNLFRKFVFWKESPPYLSIAFWIFVCACCVFFFFFCSVFWWFHFSVCPTQKTLVKNLS